MVSNMLSNWSLRTPMCAVSAGKPVTPGGHRARSPRRSLVSATRLRGRSPSRVQNVDKCLNIDRDCKMTGCNNSSSDTGIE
jgi:hypothetical protein